jgi:ElaB/YqjD/DUF883 family membrane-anchored ribosome-binding protein
MRKSTYAVADAAEDLRQAAADRVTPSIDAMARSVRQMRAQAGPAMHELAQGAEHLAHDSAEAVRRRAAALGQSSAGYVREHPLQSVLIAVGAGAVLAFVLSLFARPD